MNTTIQRARKSKLFGAAAGVAALAGATVALAAETSPGVPAHSDWASSGQNNHNTRYAAAERTINAGNVGTLKPKWVFTTAGNVSATATVVNGIAYVPDWGGKLWAIDTKTGKAIWSHDVSDYTGTAGAASRTSPAYWNNMLVIGTGNLMTNAHLYTTTINGKPTDVVGAGQKSGMYHALDPATGAVIWQTQAGPGGVLGGIEWGPTTDGQRIYAGISNGSHKTYTYTTFDGQKKTTTGGLWSALDAATGKILWQTAAPEDPKFITDSFVSGANGVIFGGSSGGNFYALDGRTGEVKWTFPSGGAVWSGAAIVDGVVYWGSGYDTKAREMPYDGNNNKFYAFSLDGR